VGTLTHIPIWQLVTVGIVGLIPVKIVTTYWKHGQHVTSEAVVTAKLREVTTDA